MLVWLRGEKKLTTSGSTCRDASVGQMWVELATHARGGGGVEARTLQPPVSTHFAMEETVSADSEPEYFRMDLFDRSRMSVLTQLPSSSLLPIPMLMQSAITAL